LIGILKRLCSTLGLNQGQMGERLALTNRLSLLGNRARARRLAYIGQFWRIWSKTRQGWRP